MCGALIHSEGHALSLTGNMLVANVLINIHVSIKQIFMYTFKVYNMYIRMIMIYAKI